MGSWRHGGEEEGVAVNGELGGDRGRGLTWALLKQVQKGHCLQSQGKERAAALDWGHHRECEEPPEGVISAQKRRRGCGGIPVSEGEGRNLQPGWGCL